MLPLTRGEAILSATQGWLAHAYHALLALLVFAYFGWSWTRSGQTLGMRAWRIRLESAAGAASTGPSRCVRFLLARGLGWLAALGAWYLARPGWSPPHAPRRLLLRRSIAELRLDRLRRRGPQPAGPRRACARAARRLARAQIATAAIAASSSVGPQATSSGLSP